jgi:hypothetical protein
MAQLVARDPAGIGGDLEWVTRYRRGKGDRHSRSMALRSSPTMTPGGAEVDEVPASGAQDSTVSGLQFVRSQ